MARTRGGLTVVVAPWSLSHVLGFVPIALSLGLVSAPDPDFEPRVHSSFSLDLIAGAEKKRGTSDEGLLQVDNAWGGQLLYWVEPKKTLEASAVRERSLMIRAAGDGVHQIDETFESAESPGRGSLSWSAQLEETKFRASMIDCISHHLLLTTTGPDPEAVLRVHERSLRSLKCRAARPSRTSVASATAPRPPSPSPAPVKASPPPAPEKAEPTKKAPNPGETAGSEAPKTVPAKKSEPAEETPAPAPKAPAPKAPAPKAPAPKAPAPEAPAPEDAPKSPEPKAPAEPPKTPNEPPSSDGPAADEG